MTDFAPATPPVTLPSRRRVIAGSAIAAVVLALALVFFIMPAELGIDLTGFGERSGLTGLAQKGPAANVYLQRGLQRKNVLFPLPADARPDEATLRATLAAHGMAAPAKLQTDHWQVELQPYENIEMKYLLKQGEPMIFAWRASAPVHVDQHSVPDQGGNPATESFVITDASAQTAVYVAPFTGIHGWFWQNQSLNPVTVSIEATGAFGRAVIFDQGGEHPRQLQPR